MVLHEDSETANLNETVLLMYIMTKYGQVLERRGPQISILNVSRFHVRVPIEKFHGIIVMVNVMTKTPCHVSLSSSSWPITKVQKSACPGGPQMSCSTPAFVSPLP